MPLSHVPTVPTNIRGLGLAVSNQPRGESGKQYITPVSPCSNWATVNENAGLVQTSDELSAPGLINWNAGANGHVKRFDGGQGGTSVMVRMRYISGIMTPVTIRVFGFDGAHRESDSAAPKPEQLADSNGNYDIVLTPQASDVKEATGTAPAYTRSVMVDMRGNLELLFLVSSAASAGSSIEARVI